jgi:hypothetical protein
MKKELILQLVSKRVKKGIWLTDVLTLNEVKLGLGCFVFWESNPETIPYFGITVKG